MALDWAFEIADRMSPSLQKMEKGLSDYEKSIKDVEKEIAKLERAEKMEALEREKDPGTKKMLGLKFQLSDIQSSMEHAEKAGQGMSFMDKFKNAGLIAGPWAEAISVGAEAVAKIGEVAFEAGEKIIDLGKEFLEAGIEAHEFKEETTLALEALLGTKEEAEGAFEAISVGADKTKLTRQQLAGLYTDLSAFDSLSQKNVQDVIAASLDVGATQGQGAQDAVLNAIRNAQAAGEFNTRSLMQLRGVGAASPAKFKEALAADMHKSVADIEKMLQEGKVSAAEGTKVILDLIQKGVDKGGALGSTAASIADGSVGAQMKNLRGRVEELFQDVDTKPLADAIKHIGAIIDPTGERAKKVGEEINRAFAGVANFLDEIASSDKLGPMLDEGIELAGTLEDAFGSVNWTEVAGEIEDVEVAVTKLFASGNDDKIGKDLKELFSIEGKVLIKDLGLVVSEIEKLATMVDRVEKLSGAVKNLLGADGGNESKFTGGGKGSDAMVGDAQTSDVGVFKEDDKKGAAHRGGFDIGKAFGEGLKGGIDAGGAGVEDAATGIASRAQVAVEKHLKIRSPSKVMFELGQYTSEGFSMGFENVKPPSMASIMPHLDDIAKAAPPPAAAPVAPVININISIEGGVESDVGDEIASKVRAEIFRAFEDLGISS